MTSLLTGGHPTKRQDLADHHPIAGKPLRLAVVNSHPIQYFAPLYARLGHDPEIDVTVFYCSDFSLRGAVDRGFGHALTWDVDLLSGYQSIFLGERAKRRTPSGFWSLVCPEVWREIRTRQYDAVLIHGYGYAVNLLAWLAAVTVGVPVLMRSETHLGLRRRAWKHRLRDSFLSVGYRFLDGFLAIGTANRAYYRALGVPDRKIFDVPYTVDNDRFITAAALSVTQRADVRKKYGLPVEGPVVLYASKFLRRKRPDDVIRAMAMLRNMGHDATLFMVGAGEMEGGLRELAASERLANVVFGGFINQSELPSIYAASDIFVLPAENEPWGLIVNEVMCAGIPIVISDEVGCVPDLVKDGVNGFLTKSRDVESLANAIDKLLNDERRRHRMGQASLSMISNWSFAQWREGLSAALVACVARR